MVVRPYKADGVSFLLLNSGDGGDSSCFDEPREHDVVVGHDEHDQQDYVTGHFVTGEKGLLGNTATYRSVGQYTGVSLLHK